MAGDGQMILQPYSGLGQMAGGNMVLQPFAGEGLLVGASFGAPTLEAYSSTGEMVPVSVLTGAAMLQPYSGVGYGPVSGAPSLEAYRSSGYMTGVSTGAGVMEPYRSGSLAGASRLQPYQAAGQAAQVLQETYTTKVTNTRTSAVTEFTNFAFNSFARVGQDYYGAGPTGLHRLDGTTDSGAEINWALRTGRHDDKVVELKRLPEVVLGLRSNGNVTVRVWSDDNTSHDYALPKVKTNTLHQHRVRPGKALASRYYGVELRGTKNATLELDSMQMNMKKLGTRLG